MKRRPSGSMLIPKAVVGFINHKLAEGLTEGSVSSFGRGDTPTFEPTVEDAMVMPVLLKFCLLWLKRFAWRSTE